ncbi:hypothetical protein SAMN04488543_0224 [Friedmanniella luteola]|uniref:Uncharacterized protein n=1 Tax=Friedmanniella luteola TaxID=546871 RepID=A0A1H1LDE3_9ACTN|nr:hypothetical protein [Friedmanniella luteola]SDR72584.1 hypothetical protein SAMN04488543_0224 [Friedmanniella luteola]
MSAGPGSVPFSPERVAPPAPVAPPSLVLRGAATGAAAGLAAMFVYQLLRIGWLLAQDLTRGAGATPGTETATRVVGVLVLGSLLSLAPAVVAGLVLGAVTGGLLSWSWRRQGLIRSWLTGSLVAYVAAFGVNATVLLRDRPQPLRFEHWLTLVGLPSALYVLVLGGVGASLYLSGRATERGVG